ncbi:Hypothetical predicted protein [Pelobates cultripes]|uniref:Uncharacterized protein n=1 Tax=Pelobates cultripes TaxID=61616 RepID=A0AAD1RIC4_PELCU|nr:Hypothetical predicted protein [Pelobates cultripes]
MQAPPNQRRLPSPPSQHRLQSPPNGHRLPSPPIQNKPPSPPTQRRLPSPPNFFQEPRSPSNCSSSPPVSPSVTHKGLRRSSDEILPSSKVFGNAQSIFCPSSSSLFETKKPTPPNNSGIEVGSTQTSVMRHNLSGYQYGDQHRRMAMSAANPQPFIRRCYSDRRPRVQLRLPGSISSSSSCDSALQHIGTEEPAQKDSESDLRAPSLAPSQPELCVVGQGLQKE